ncbi:MAG: F0F1 ATP synthase subunit gamma [Clostridiales bacterium]|nr:F0F1 ATP synthase subunit gamma [Clostridiales bacterium]
MGADTKQLRIRIKSVDSSLHLTKAMGLVASSKIRRANEEMKKTKQYLKALEIMVKELTMSPECRKSPYLRITEEPIDSKRTKLIVIAGDRGLAGGYNANIFRLLRDYPKCEIIPLGRRICDRTSSEFVSSETFSYKEARELALKLCEEFVNGDYDRLGIVCTRYVNMMTQTAEVRWILPLTKDENAGKTGMIFEPDEMTVLTAAVPEYVTGSITEAVRESFASEVAARRMAMDSAEKNARAMIEDLELQYNRARQSAITQEITEIVAGSGK